MNKEKKRAKSCSFFNDFFAQAKHFSPRAFFNHEKRAQGTVEYLVIVAVVIVISLIVVGLVIGMTSSNDVAGGGQKIGQQIQEISIKDILLKPDGNYAVDLQSNLIENITITRIAFDEDYEDFVGDNFLALGSRKVFVVNIDGLRRPDRCIESSLVTKNITITYIILDKII